jgi:hypothetical protein
MNLLQATTIMAECIPKSAAICEMIAVTLVKSLPDICYRNMRPTRTLSAKHSLLATRKPNELAREQLPPVWSFRSIHSCPRRILRNRMALVGNHALIFNLGVSVSA